MRFACGAPIHFPLELLANCFQFSVLLLHSLYPPSGASKPDGLETGEASSGERCEGDAPLMEHIRSSLKGGDGGTQ
jgi:hypothetical protein